MLTDKANSYHQSGLEFTYILSASRFKASSNYILNMIFIGATGSQTELLSITYLRHHACRRCMLYVEDATPMLRLPDLYTE